MHVATFTLVGFLFLAALVCAQDDPAAELAAIREAVGSDLAGVVDSVQQASEGAAKTEAVEAGLQLLHLLDRLDAVKAIERAAEKRSELKKDAKKAKKEFKQIEKYLSQMATKPDGKSSDKLLRIAENLGGSSDGGEDQGGAGPTDAPPPAARTFPPIENMCNNEDLTWESNYYRPWGPDAWRCWFFNEELLTFAEARAACHARDMELVVVDWGQMNSELSNHVSSRSANTDFDVGWYVGVKYDEASEQYDWITRNDPDADTPAFDDTVTYWYRDQPQREGGDCVAMIWEDWIGWQTVDCTIPRPSMCFGVATNFLPDDS